MGETLVKKSLVSLLLNFILACAVSLMLCACSSDPAEKQNTDSGSKSATASANATATAPRYGGQIVISSIGEPSGLISSLTTDSSSHEVAGYFYIGCLRYNKKPGNRALGGQIL